MLQIVVAGIEGGSQRELTSLYAKRMAAAVMVVGDLPSERGHRDEREARADAVGRARADPDPE